MNRSKFEKPFVRSGCDSPDAKHTTRRRVDALPFLLKMVACLFAYVQWWENVAHIHPRLAYGPDIRISTPSYQSPHHRFFLLLRAIFVRLFFFGVYSKYSYIGESKRVIQLIQISTHTLLLKRARKTHHHLYQGLYYVVVVVVMTKKRCLLLSCKTFVVFVSLFLWCSEVHRRRRRRPLLLRLGDDDDDDDVDFIRCVPKTQKESIDAAIRSSSSANNNNNNNSAKRRRVLTKMARKERRSMYDFESRCGCLDEDDIWKDLLSVGVANETLTKKERDDEKDFETTTDAEKHFACHEFLTQYGKYVS